MIGDLSVRRVFWRWHRLVPGVRLLRELMLGLWVGQLALTALLLSGVATAAVEAPAPVIVVFGDSFTAGLGLPRQEAFPAQLEAWVRAQGRALRVISAGKSGDTTEAALSRLAKAAAEHPDIVILELGTNDALRGIDPKITKANLAIIIEMFQKGGAKVLLTGVLAPPNWGEEYREAFDRVYPELARSFDVPLYPSFLEGVALKPEFNQADRLHPNAQGVAIIVSHLGPVVVNLFLTEPNASPR